MTGLDELSYVKSGGPSAEECTKLDGIRVKIASIEVIDDVGPVYDDKNKKVEGQEKKMKKVKLTTEGFGSDLIGREIVHVEKYNLKEKDGQWSVSLHEKAKTGQFLAKYEFEKFEEAIGTEVIMTKKTNPETKKSWLSISI